MKIFKFINNEEKYSQSEESHLMQILQEIEESYATLNLQE